MITGAPAYAQALTAPPPEAQVSPAQVSLAQPNLAGGAPAGFTQAEFAEFKEYLAGGEYLSGPFTYADIAFYMASFFGDRMGAPMTPAIS